MTRSTLKNRIPALLLALAVLLPAFSFFTPAKAAEYVGPEAAEEAKELVSKGDFAEGEVIALVTKASSYYYEAEELLSVSKETVQKAAEYCKDREMNSIPADGDFSKECKIVLIKDGSRSTEEMLRELIRDPDVLRCEPNYRTEPCSARDRDITDLQWGVKNAARCLTTESAPAAANASINEEGWDKYDENGAPIENAVGYVAVVDTGIDVNNGELKNVIATDMRKYSDIGGDYGYNAADENDDIIDRDGHGTHCAGIIAAEWNRSGISGAACGVKLIAVKHTSDETGEMSVDAIIRAYDYLSGAMDRGLPLVAVNNSYNGGTNLSDLMLVCVTQLGEKGAVSVFSSGNQGVDCDVNDCSTTGFSRCPYAVIAGAMGPDGKQCSFSNYGKHTTDVFAPGLDILSTLPEEKGQYIPEFDDDPVFTDCFDGDSTDIVLTGKKVESTAEMNENVIGSARISGDYGFSGKSSLLITDLTEKNYTYTVVVNIPIPRERAEEVRHVSFYVYNDEFFIADYYYDVKNAEGETEQETGYTLAFSGWAPVEINVAEGEGFCFFPAGDDVLYLSVKVEIVRDIWYDVPDNLHIYIDSVGVSSKSKTGGFGYDTGTSMAAPMVAAAAAIVAKRQAGENGADSLFSENAAEIALERADILKASVTVTDDLRDLCRSGGYLDLTVKPEDYAPVIHMIDFDRENGTITLEGAFFGDRCIIDVSGFSLPVISRTDSKIVLDASNYDKRVTTLKITAENGKSTDAMISDPLETFEGKIRLNLDDAYSMRTVQYDGKLYSIFSEDDLWTNEIFYHKMELYDSEEKKWVGLAPLPEKLYHVSVTVHDGKMIVCGTYDPAMADVPSTDGIRMFSYDFANDTWTKLSAPALPWRTSIVSVAGRLVAVGGREYEGSLLSSDEIGLLSLDGENVTVKKIGTLNYSREEAALAVYGDNLYVASGYNYNSEGQKDVASGVEAVSFEDFDGNALSAGKITDLSDKTAAIPLDSSTCGFAATEYGLIFSGIKGGEYKDTDTYFLRYGASKPERLKSASKYDIEDPYSIVIGDVLYTSGYQPTGAIAGLMYTKLEIMPEPEPEPQTEPEPPTEPESPEDPEPTTPSESGTVSETKQEEKAENRETAIGSDKSGKNRDEEQKQQPVSPKTGDNFAFIIAVFVVSLSALTALSIKKKRGNR